MAKTNYSFDKRRKELEKQKKKEEKMKKKEARKKELLQENSAAEAEVDDGGTRTPDVVE